MQSAYICIGKYALRCMQRGTLPFVFVVLTSTTTPTVRRRRRRTCNLSSFSFAAQLSGRQLHTGRKKEVNKPHSHNQTHTHIRYMWLYKHYDYIDSTDSSPDICPVCTYPGCRSDNVFRPAPVPIIGQWRSAHRSAPIRRHCHPPIPVRCLR